MLSAQQLVLVAVVLALLAPLGAFAAGPAQLDIDLTSHTIGYLASIVVNLWING